MAAPTFNQIVKDKLPYLGSDDDVLIGNYIKEVQYKLQDDLEKTNLQVEDENEYSNKEKYLVGTYSAYNLLKQQSLKTIGGTGDTGSGSTAPNTKQIKKAKADVVEAEFQQIKSSDGSNIAMNTKDLLEQLRIDVCCWAKELNVVLSICNSGVIEMDLTPPFLYFE